MARISDTQGGLETARKDWLLLSFSKSCPSGLGLKPVLNPGVRGRLCLAPLAVGPGKGADVS